MRDFFRQLFYNFFKNILKCFSGYNFLWHLLAIALTYVIVTTDFDWQYFRFMGMMSWDAVFFPAIILGALLPILFPIALLVWGKIKESQRIINAGFSLGQAAIAGLLISDFYKTLTGRIPPMYSFQSTGPTFSITDISRGFQFGFLRGGVFWGWPSTHTTIAFAMAFTIWKLFPEQKIMKYLAVAYAFYIGIGVSFTIHWFSEFVAGAIIGAVIGMVVGGSFGNKFSADSK